MTDDLVARLRHEHELCVVMGDTKAGALVGEAADRLEALEIKERESFQKFVDANEARIDAEARVRELEAEVSGVSAAIGTTRFMDPPDGGSVTLSEQVARMRQALDAAEGRLSTIKSETIERCAKVADKVEFDAESELSGLFYSERYGMSCRSDAATEIAAAIRKLAQEERHAKADAGRAALEGSEK